MAAQLFGNAGLEHMEKYGTTEEHFAKVVLSQNIFINVDFIRYYCTTKEQKLWIQIQI